MSNFNLKRFLVENKITKNSRTLQEMWGSDDEALQQASSQSDRKLLQQFVDWAKSNKGTRKYSTVDSEKINGVDFRWREYPEERNNWQKFELKVRTPHKNYTGTEWKPLGPNTDYMDVIDFEDWNGLFMDLYKNSNS